MKKTRKLTRLNLALLLVFAAATVAADTYGDARERLVAAYQANDFAAMVEAASAGLVARPDFPGGLYNLAFAHTLAGEYDRAFDALDRLGAMRIDYAIEDIDAFAPLLEHPRFADYEEAIRETRKVHGVADVAWQLSDGHFIPEGIAIVGQVLYLGSIRNGTIVRVEPGGQPRKLLENAAVGSVYGMRQLGDQLWFAAANTDQFVGGDAPTTGIFAMDLESETLTGRFPLPELDARQTLGDLVGYGEGFIVADQTDGRLYAFDLRTHAYSVFLERGALQSPQGVVVHDDALLVADWNGGLFAMDLETKTLARVDGGSTSLYGIDGLYRHGDWLIAIQNGIRPNRVTALRLSDAKDRVIESRILAMNHAAFDEPNLGVVADGAFYFIANSHWNRFDRENNLPDGLSGPTILRVALPKD